MTKTSGNSKPLLDPIVEKHIRQLAWTGQHTAAIDFSDTGISRRGGVTPP